jgi:hypothetical protein
LLLGGRTPAEEKRNLTVYACAWLAFGAGFVLWGAIGFADTHMVFVCIGALLLCLGGGLFAASRFAYREYPGAGAE